MNDINTSYIEGVVIECAKSGDDPVRFKVASKETRGKGGDQIVKVDIIPIEAGGHLAEKCREECLPGRRIRVVGRLVHVRGDEGDTYRIEASHMEFLKQGG